jgi:hypothetical protein
VPPGEVGLRFIIRNVVHRGHQVHLKVPTWHIRESNIQVYLDHRMLIWVRRHGRILRKDGNVQSLQLVVQQNYQSLLDDD